MPPAAEPAGEREPETSGVPTFAAAPGRTRPNYTRRRLAAAVAAVAVLGGLVAGTAALVSRLSGDGARSAPTSIGWDAVAMIDDRSGMVTLIDDRGDPIGAIDSGVADVAAADSAGATLVLVGATGIAMVDTSTPDAPPTAIDLVSDGTVTRPFGTNATLAVGSETGARVVLARHDGAILDTDTFAPVVGARYQSALAVADASGEHVLIGDAGNFQSVLLSFDREEPSYFPGLPVAVDDERVITTQNVGNQATISVFDHDGQPLATATSSPIRGGLLAERLVVVAVDGTIVAIDTSSGKTDPSATIDGAGAVTTADVTVTGDRLVTQSDAGVSIADDEGGIVATISDASLTLDPRSVHRTACVLVDTADGVAAVSLADGTVVTTFPNGVDPALVTADGCATFPGELPTGRAVALAPDGVAVVAVEGGRLTLVAVDEAGDAAGDAVVDLGPARQRFVFVDRSAPT